MKQLEGKLSISRPSAWNGDEYISLTLRDDSAGVDFVEARISYADFTKAITGQAYIPCKLLARELEHVGMIRERDTITFEIVEAVWSKRDETARHNLEVELEEINKEYVHKWLSTEQFRSQNSFFTKDGKDMARAHIHRWVPTTDKEEDK